MALKTLGVIKCNGTPMSIIAIQGAKGTSYRVQLMRSGKRISKTFPTKKAAKEFEARMTVDSDLITSLTDTVLTTYTFAQVAAEYLAQHTGKDQSVYQRIGYWVDLFGPRTINKIRAVDIQTALADMAAKGRAPGTLNRYRTTLSALFEYLKDQYQLKINPAREVKAKKEGPGRSRFLNPSEIDRLLVACRASSWPRLYLLVLMAVTTGARRSELLNLTWSQIDFDNAIARIQTSKNGQPRILPLTSSVVNELSKFRQASGYLFPHIDSYSKGPWTTFDGTWYIARAAAGLGKDVCFHTLRHTTASLMASNNVSLLAIADTLGHKTMSMVQRYAHLAVGAKAQMINEQFGQFG